jgi:autotransporter strand-loop-strand O-heptosyltransferase
MKDIFIKVNSKSLGDTLASTPSIRKVAKSYDCKINVVTHVKELFENNPNVKNIYSFEQFEKLKINKNTEIFETFCGIGIKDKNGIEKKHATIDIRRFHAMDLGFDLLDEEMHYDYIPKNDRFININKKYICLHISKTWDSRTYSSENWQTIISCLEKADYYVVLIGNNANETGFYNINKTVHDIKLNNGIDLCNKLNLSQLWHVLNESICVITMDSGILHFAGTTDTFIIQLGSSINNKLRAPYRNGTQNHKYKYISGSCDIFCASNMKYGIKEWGSINGVPPLIKCLENKPTFECHPNAFSVVEFILQNFRTETIENKKYLFIAGHLSTGGAPKYLLWLINEIKKKGNEVKVVEWNLYSSIYTVQRDQIINLIGQENFITVGTHYEADDIFYNNEKRIQDLIINYQPDYIHINDYVEQLAIKPPSKDFLNFLYDNNRKYKIFETLHDSAKDVNDKIYLPNEFWFCSSYHSDNYMRKDVPHCLKEMDIQKNKRPDRSQTLISLGLDPSYIHVLQVGLFNKNKNQKFTFDLAKNFLNEKIQFHFIGNDCYIDECDIDKNQKNCKIWGERSDVDKFMSCMDLFILPSFAELNPISLKEAISWDMPCFIYKLKTLQHLKNDLVKYIEDNTLNKHIRELINNNIMIETTDNNQIIHSFIPSPKVEIKGDNDYKYEIKFIDLDTNIIHHSGIINNNMWISCNIEYFCNWRINIKNIFLNTEKNIDINLKNKKVKIVNESSSLGDLISWVPYIQEFKNKHDCEIDFYTPNKNLFEDQYPQITFYNYNQDNIKYSNIYYASYKIGFFGIENKHLCKKDFRLIGLQEIASGILGLEHKEILTNVTVKNKERKLNDKYVCISTASTAGCKHWHHENGWQNVVDYLNKLGYKVVVIQKESLDYMDLKGLNNVIHPTTSSIDDAITWLHNCEFFVGLSSGISWLAWALKKKVVMISGFTKEFNEFYTPYRIINKNVCNGCWNNIKYKFDAGDWNWCPAFKNTNRRFECSKSITFDVVKEKIDLLLNDLEISKNKTDVRIEKMKKFDSFTYKEIFEWNQYEKYIKVEKNDFVLDLGCSKGYFYFKNSYLDINYVGVDGSIDCIKDFIENLNQNESPKLINAVLSKNKEVIEFPSMFHQNKINTVVSTTFPDLIAMLNRKIDFMKFDIEGYEKYFLFENLDLFKKYIKKFTGEFHFNSDISTRQQAVSILNNLRNDKQINLKLFSIDGVDITESFWNDTNYYTEIIISGYNI